MRFPLYASTLYKTSSTEEQSWSTLSKSKDVGHVAKCNKPFTWLRWDIDARRYNKHWNIIFLEPQITASLYCSMQDSWRNRELQWCVTGIYSNGLQLTIKLVHNIWIVFFILDESWDSWPCIIALVTATPSLRL